MEPLNKEHILIVEDDSEVLQQLIEFFEENPFIDVLSCPDLGTCYESYLSQRATIILISYDCEERRKNLFSFIEKVREIDPLVVLILLTSSKSVLMDSHIASSGIDDVLIKPLDRQTFGYRIFLNMARMRRCRAMRCSSVDLTTYTDQIQQVRKTMDKLREVFSGGGDGGE